MFSVLGWMLFGLIVGIIAKLVMPGKDPGGIFVTMLVGIVGALIGGFIGRALGLYQPILRRDARRDRAAVYLSQSVPARLRPASSGGRRRRLPIGLRSVFSKFLHPIGQRLNVGLLDQVADLIAGQRHLHVEMARNVLQ